MATAVPPPTSTALVPPARWVDSLPGSEFSRVRGWALNFRLGSAPWAEIESGAVTWRSKPVNEDGVEVEVCEAPGLAPGQLTVRDFVAAAYRRGFDYFERSQTRDFRSPLQADLQLVLVDAQDKRVTAPSCKLHRPPQGQTTINISDESPLMVGEVRESSKNVGDLSRSLCTALVAVSAKNTTRDMALDGLALDGMRCVQEGYKGLLAEHRLVRDDLVVAADQRARAECHEELLAEREKYERPWYDRLLDSETGHELVKTAGPIVLPAVGGILTSLVTALGKRIELATMGTDDRLSEAKQRRAARVAAAVATAPAVTAAPSLPAAAPGCANQPCGGEVVSTLRGSALCEVCLRLALRRTVDADELDADELVACDVVEAVPCDAVEAVPSDAVEAAPVDLEARHAKRIDELAKQRAEKVTT